MKLLIPSHSIELTGEVQQVLLLANQQGFATSHIELGISPTQYLELVDTTTSRFSTNLFDASIGAIAEIERNFIYSHLESNTEACSIQNVYIGCSRNIGVSDMWHHVNATAVLSDVQTLSIAQSWRHLAWVLAALCLEFPLEDAMVLSRAALNVSRETWPDRFEYFPQPLLSEHIATHLAFPSISKESLGVYPVVDDVSWIERLLELGATTIQLRIKDPSRDDLESQIVRAIQLGKHYNAQVFINDYWQLAIKHGAFGVHLGQEDIEEATLDAINDAGICLGLSTHGYYELLRINQLCPSYIALGHIFPTTTKQMPSKPQGLVRLGLYQKQLDSMPYASGVGVPSVAIGGIDLTNARQVVQQGVSSIAVVRAITQADNPKEALTALQQSLNYILNTSQQEVCDVIG